MKRENDVREEYCSCFHDKVGKWMFNLDGDHLPSPPSIISKCSHSYKSKSNPNTSNNSKRLMIKAHLLVRNSFKMTLRRTVQIITEIRKN